MKRIIDALKPEEIHALLESFTGQFATRNRCIVELMLHTGLRIAEATGLNVSDVFDHDRVRNDLYVRAETAKRKKARYIPLNSRARAAISRALNFNRSSGFPTDPGAPLFVSQKQGPRGERRLCPRAFQHIIRQKRKDLPTNLTVTSHLFRHTFITGIYRNTKDLQIAQELAGHSHITTTIRYMHRSRDEKRAAVALLEGKTSGSAQSNTPETPGFELARVRPKLAGTYHSA